MCKLFYGREWLHRHKRDTEPGEGTVVTEQFDRHMSWIAACQPKLHTQDLFEWPICVANQCCL